ncbi:glycerophosphodiester phosphodiesterase family protein [Pelagicoccus enzymogenes]|uniref:glycerophosphodiester phosphodiesterase family protein n=1 Tax=Pelagicoccus enzymogenes TaxID=2773457 RepID=UPI002810471B|nr:glycerophosphodiester phosphodiesterase family protein [Pelagicoccus enzymogenes]MDQ8197533.1 glycerophosphodiester phosphodiesterase family protein [Pelagicoccus enzymogenes]
MLSRFNTLIFFSTLAYLSMQASPTSPAPQLPLIVAHRGASADAPENTLPAFRLAWEQGADAIEGDFHLTRDKRIICIHNSTTGKYANKSLTVRKSKLADLQALVPAPHKFPTLAEVIATVPPDKKLYIEIKSSRQIVRPLLKEIDASGISPQQVVVIAFSGRVIKKLKSQRPSLKAVLLATPRYRSKARTLEPTPEQLLEAIKRTGADGVSLYAHPDIDAAYTQPFLDAGHELHVWTVDAPETAKKWTDLGALSLTTNNPATLRQSLGL